MSGFCAWYCFDKRPVPKIEMNAMLGQMNGLGPDGSALWMCGEIALGYQRMCTTPEGEHERQPIFDPDVNSCLAFDGRVDNRAELIDLLGTDVNCEHVTDAALVASAYKRWGVECAQHIVGDFAFAIWDGGRRHLYCARDHAGVRPLFYSRTPKAFLAASTQAALLASGEVSQTINEGTVGEYLCVRMCSAHETLYQDVKRLAPGHWLTVDARGVRVQRYWRPEEIQESRLSSEELVERFLDLFRESVRARARANRALAVDLSGGLDSSSVACMVSELRARGSIRQTFEAFSWTFPGLACDETDYASCIVKRHGFEWNRVSLEPLPTVDYSLLARRNRDFPGYPNDLSSEALKLARDKNMRVVLRGTGSDEWLSGASSFARCIDFVTAGRLPMLAHDLRNLNAREALRAARSCVGFALEMLHLGWVREVYSARRLPSWINRDFVRRIHLVERLNDSAPFNSQWSRSRRLRLRRATSAWAPHSLELDARTAAGLNVEPRYPFLDRRLVELMIALPDEQCYTAGTHKVLLRTALSGCLPNQVRSRRTKADFSHVFWQTLGAKSVQEAFDNLSVGGPGWVHTGVARAAYSRRQDEGHRCMWPLWMLYGIDTWFRIASGS